ncbi:GspH/FimT family pseudopilin [Thioalkalivibrio sp. ALR17-21]|uniref:GspH/FimT family pseudopilin n=1 Tax=Thioalkalivibrio sp. ALR17-21 TaxID=1269813 RepID=UPI00041C6F5D|nr:GspH/FimT family pseudopilin [Thioalkalivibrio sp. ALR17-21]
MTPTAYRPRTRGLTLIELLVALLVFVLLVTVGIPSFAQLVDRFRLIATTNELVTALHHARSEAVRTAAPVTLCASANGVHCSGDGRWESGWLVFHNPGLATQPASANDILRRRQGNPGGGLEIRGNLPVRHRVTYGALGATRRLSGALQMGTLRICNEAAGRAVVINRAGRPRVAHQGCPFDP